MAERSQHDIMAEKFGIILPILNERQRRLLLAAEANAVGHGGIIAVSRASGVSRGTIVEGIRELAEGVVEPSTRVRREGGGRKRVEETDPAMVAALDQLISPDTRGDPESPLRWTCKSIRQLVAALAEMGFSVSTMTVRRLLQEMGYSLQGNAKVKEGNQHPDRNLQFEYINEQVKAHQAQSSPVLSVDTKKKELVGEYKNGGREWQPEGQPVKVNVHDFPDPAVGKAIPYGLYDLAQNSGWVGVGTDHDTSSFAVETIRRWWYGEGIAVYPNAPSLLICADGGGSNGYRARLWKTELAALADETGLDITVCHFPPGTSKWNKIEHRLFSHISMNWRGRPLTSHDVVVDLIGATRTTAGLRIHAELDDGIYPTQVKVTDADFASVPLTAHKFHPEWNYQIGPRTAPKSRQ
jgi:transposase